MCKKESERYENVERHQGIKILDITGELSFNGMLPCYHPLECCPNSSCARRNQRGTKMLKGTKASRYMI
jgi:hypothetical protein